MRPCGWLSDFPIFAPENCFFMCAAIAEDLSHFKAVAVFFVGWLKFTKEKFGAFFLWLA